MRKDRTEYSPGDPFPPFPGWVHRVVRLPRPVTNGDIMAFLGDEDFCTRDTGSGTVYIIHKYGILEIHAVIGEKRIGIWYDPDKGPYSAEYLDALLSTRF